MKKIVTVVGARPQFIKAAVLSRLILEEYGDSCREFIIHTGQHYDKNMSQIFFREMNIPEPDINLEVGSGSHGKMTGRMLEGIENVLLREKPDLLLVYGDTNSTLAGALAASKLSIPAAHVEAGLRSFNMQMPEEQNRILTDHIASFLFCPTDTAVRNLLNEGITCGVHNSGDVMLDASLYYRELFSDHSPIPAVNADCFVLMTLHRAENTDNPERLTSIVNAVNRSSDRTFILPLHPRTRKVLADADLSFNSHVHVIEPVGFREMLSFEQACDIVLTDSGGVQKEAFFLKKSCITMRDQTEWIETVNAGCNVLVGADEDKIVAALSRNSYSDKWPDIYGNGRSGQKILEELIKVI